ncbi:DUF2931 family protein [Lelliottia nimipressuralis]|uniref:DUF2931 family protein n=1 Tax=Lelliottia nimipressuralis TaxID=69220 RepID=UPI001E5BB5BE|nr:DUF2931 family protein [Lelliottia nimipressuralis]MCD4560829.1 DUF2931 family protein [Lelliottia nimipressuralis]
MNYGKQSLLIMLLILSGCHTGEPTLPEETGAMPYGMWGFVFFTPKELPAFVNYVGIIDEKNILYSFRNLDSTDEDDSSVSTWDKQYMRFATFNKARHPPVNMLFCWDSIIDKQTYETRITFPDSVRTRMSLSTGVDMFGEKAWYSTMLFGLAPGGKVRVWLQNSGGGDNLPVEPLKISTLSGGKLEGCKGISNLEMSYEIPDGYDQNIKDFIKGKTYPYGEW